MPRHPRATYSRLRNNDQHHDAILGWQAGRRGRFKMGCANLVDAT